MKDNGIEVIEVAAPVPPIVYILGSIGFVCAAIIVVMATMGNVIAIMASTAVATTTLIIIGHRLGTASRATEYRGRAACMRIEDEQWRLAMEAKVNLLGQVAQTQATQALTQQRGTAAERNLRPSTNGHDKSVEELVMGGDFTDAL